MAEPSKQLRLLTLQVKTDVLKADAHLALMDALRALSGVVEVKLAAAVLVPDTRSSYKLPPVGDDFY